MRPKKKKKRKKSQIMQMEKKNACNFEHHGAWVKKDMHQKLLNVEKIHRTLAVKDLPLMNVIRESFEN